MPVDGFETMRAAMVASQLRPSGVDDPALVAAMALVPRELFVPSGSRAVAYADLQIPLGDDRVLNTPMVTGRLLDAAAVTPGERVLIIAAGTGYSAAILTQLGAFVVAVEPSRMLADQLRRNVPGVEAVEAPLSEGAPELAPFDALIIEGAVEQLPEALVTQLAEGGRMAAGLVENGPTRLARGRRVRDQLKLIPFADADVVVLPDFARPRSFVF